jgi:4'-phosphopantetheinyl transferase EntD
VPYSSFSASFFSPNSKTTNATALNFSSDRLKCIINIERVEQILNKNKDGFVRRVLSEHEQALFANKGDSAAYCAKRFAAKEAFAKALGKSQVIAQLLWCFPVLARVLH